jgi:FKBP-type peptidyl-prolyl cis-trans isomerase FkpA
MVFSARKLSLPAIALLTLGLAACGKDGASPQSVDLEAESARFGYAIGVDLGESLSPVRDEIDIDALKAGLDDAYQGRDLKLDDVAREEIKNAAAERIQASQAKAMSERAEASKEAGDKFMAENAARDGVTVTDSGLQYEVLTDAEGAKPTAEDRVTVHYRGTLIDGTEFDSSYSRGEPVTFPLGNVIAGWTEGVQLMSPGAKYKFVIPASLGYGERGAGNRIGPNETLVFEVELISIDDASSENTEG